MKAISKLQIYSIYAFCIISFGLIKVVKINDIPIYFSTLISLCVLLTFMIKLDYKQIIKDKINNIIIIYCSYVLINSMMANGSYMLHSIDIIMPFIIFIILTYFFENNIHNLYKIKRLCTFIIILTSVLALITYIIGYGKVEIYFKKDFLEFVPHYVSVSTFGERRLEWIFTHKSRFAIYCSLGIMFLIANKKMDIKRKLIFGSILLVDIYLTNSKTILFITALSIISYILYYFFNKHNSELKKVISKNKKPIMISVLVLFILFILFFISVLKSRNLYTLGGRIYIWETSIKYVIAKPFGITYMNDSFFLSNAKLDFSFTNGHNILINEAIERGIVGLSLYLLALISIMKKIFNKVNPVYFIFLIGILISSMMDYVIAAEVTYIFWTTMAIVYSEEKIHKNNLTIS